VIRVKIITNAVTAVLHRTKEDIVEDMIIMANHMVVADPAEADLEEVEVAVPTAKDGEMTVETMDPEEEKVAVIAPEDMDMTKDMIKDMIKEVMDMIIMDMTIEDEEEVDMATTIMVEADMEIKAVMVVVILLGLILLILLLEMRSLTVQNKDLKVIMIMNLDQSISSKETLKSQLVMAQKQDLMVIGTRTLDQSQRILRTNSGPFNL